MAEQSAPINIRLFPEQLVFVANHGEDHVIIVDPTLLPLLNPQLPQLSTVKHIIVTGDSLTLDGPCRALRRWAPSHGPPPQAPALPASAPAAVA